MLFIKAEYICDIICDQNENGEFVILSSNSSDSDDYTDDNTDFHLTYYEINTDTLTDKTRHSSGKHIALKNGTMYLEYRWEDRVCAYNIKDGVDDGGIIDFLQRPGQYFTTEKYIVCVSNILHSINTHRPYFHIDIYDIITFEKKGVIEIKYDELIILKSYKCPDHIFIIQNCTILQINLINGMVENSLQLPLNTLINKYSPIIHGRKVIFITKNETAYDYSVNISDIKCGTTVKLPDIMMGCKKYGSKECEITLNDRYLVWNDKMGLVCFDFSN